MFQALHFLLSAIDSIQKSPSKLSASTINASAIDSKIKTAYDTYKGTDGWQRDYIYYNITPGQTKGKFSYDYQEHITSFSMNDGNNLAIISDQEGDPVNTPKYYSPKWQRDAARSPWTGNAFRFKINVLINAKNGVGTSTEP